MPVDMRGVQLVALTGERTSLKSWKRGVYSRLETSHTIQRNIQGWASEHGIVQILQLAGIDAQLRLTNDGIESEVSERSDNHRSE